MKTLLDRTSRIYYDNWESQSEAVRARTIRKKLDDYVRFAGKTAPFYKKTLSGYEKGAEYPLSRVPALTPDDLRKSLPPKSDKLFSQKTGNYSVFQSGGTTGSPKTTLFTHEELEALNLPNARGFFASGLNKSDRVCNVFATGSLYMTFIHINRMLQQYGCMNFPFSNYAPVDFIRGIIKLFNINCIAGITSVVLTCMRKMKEMGLEGIKIEKIYYGGEHLYPQDRQYLRENFKTRIISAPGYGSVDSWYIGYQCLSCAPGVFHAHDDQCYIEIVDEDSGENCAHGKPGMLYATAFERVLTPIVRYKVGDKALWLGKKCGCGRTTPLFKLLGRGDDVLRIGYDSIDHDYVLESARRALGSPCCVQMEKKHEKGRDLLIVRVESSAAPSQYPKLKGALKSEIIGGRQTLKKLIADKSVWPVRFEMCKSIKRNPRTGKFIKVIDAI
ncbi:phenylacetate--CoA ligase family protein [Elusimicrobiota bacterium]